AAGMDAARVGKLPRIIEVAGVVEVADALGRIKPIDRPAGQRGEGGAALRALLECRLQDFPLPSIAGRLRGHALHQEHYRSFVRADGLAARPTSPPNSQLPIPKGISTGG